MKKESVFQFLCENQPLQTILLTLKKRAPSVNIGYLNY